MSGEPADVGTFTEAQLAELFNHFVELDQVRLAGNNGLIVALLTHPDTTDVQREMLNAWSADMNLIGQKSAAEIARILADRPRNTH